MAGMTERYDSALLGILQHEGNISPFLDAVMGFLYRRTDFYRIMKHSSDKMGFPPGIAQKILLNAFKKYESLAIKDEEMRDKQLSKKRLHEKLPEPTDTIPPPAAKIVEIETEANIDVQTAESCDKASSQSQTSSSNDNQLNVKTEQCVIDTCTDTSDKQELSDSDRLAEDSKDLDSQSDKNNPPKEDEDDNSELARMQQVYQSNPESYNGAIRDNYRWSQSILDLDVRVNVPKFIKKGRDVTVVIDKKHLKVSHKTETGGWSVMVDENLTWEVNKEECLWSLVPGEHIHINLDKKEERWWEALLETEPKISVRKIDASRPMSDLDDEAQAKIGEMMYNEQQKRLGCPTSEEQKVHGVLKDAWNAEGSPFKGTDFDPSKFLVNQGVVTIKDD